MLTKSSINSRGYNKYLKLEGEIAISTDEKKFAADAAWDGIKGYVTNTKLSALIRQICIICEIVFAVGMFRL
jgi:hypothetical protein